MTSAPLGAAFAGGPVTLAYSRFDDHVREASGGHSLEPVALFGYL